MRDNSIIKNLSSSIANPFAGLLPGTTLNGATTTRSQLLLPYPQYTGFSVLDRTNGTSNYNSLNASLNYRLVRGISGFVHYTWSRTIDQNSKLNDVDTKYEKRISPFDYPNHLVFAGTYRLPFAAAGGKGFTGHAAHAVLGGWSLSGIYTLQSGSPLVWGTLIYNGVPLKLNPRETMLPAFDTTQFNTVSSQQLANDIRTFHSTYSQ